MAQLPGLNAAKPPGSSGSTTRITALDSLRGPAALIVVFHHLDNTLDPDGRSRSLGPILHHSALRLLVDGRFAVILFFVLSGFALSVSIGERFNYWRYLLKRICRLMIPCAASVLVAAAAYSVVHPKPIPGLGDWFNYVLWNEPVSLGLIARHFLMTGAQADTSLVNVLWSLVIELRISLIFPILYLAAKGRTKSAFVASIALQFLFRYLTQQSGNFVPFFNDSWTEALENIGYYMPFFIVGIVARENFGVIKGFVTRMPKFVVFLALLGALWLGESGEDMKIGLGAFLILCICVSAPYISNALSVRPIKWLGQISYSLYLVHLTVLATAFHLFYGKINDLELCTLVVLGSLVVAQLMYWLVEKPSMELGRWLTRDKPKTVTAMWQSVS